MIGQPGEYIGEPDLRIDVVELGGLNQRVDGGSAAAAIVGAGESPVLAADGNGAQLALGGIVGHAQPTVVNEARFWRWRRLLQESQRSRQVHAASARASCPQALRKSI